MPNPIVLVYPFFFSVARFAFNLGFELEPNSLFQAIGFIGMDTLHERKI